MTNDKDRVVDDGADGGYRESETSKSANLTREIVGLLTDLDNDESRSRTLEAVKIILDINSLRNSSPKYAPHRVNNSSVVSLALAPMYPSA